MNLQNLTDEEFAKYYAPYRDDDEELLERFRSAIDFIEAQGLTDEWRED